MGTVSPINGHIDYTFPNWISVDFKLPEKRGNYLCYYHYEPHSPDVICENEYLGSGHWLSEESKVTHWMPLPPLPQED